MYLNAIKKFSFLFAFVLFIQSCFPVSSIAQQPSLYDRLGGIYAIAAVVDDFVEGLLKNEVVLKNEKVAAALGKITKAGLKYRITEFVSQATGGPEKYTGRTMKDSHAGLAITEGEWNATVGELLKSLAKFNVPKKEQDDLIAVVATTKGDIVTAKAPPAAPQAPAPQAQAPPAAPQVPQPQAPPAPPPSAPPAAPQAPALASPPPSGELVPPPPDVDLPTN